MYGYVYKVTHVPSGKYYIGQRMYNGDPFSDNYLGSGTVWKRFTNKYDVSEFSKEILAVCETREELNELEKYFIGDLYKTDSLCMNLCEGGGTTSGYKFSEESKRKIGNAELGNKYWLGKRHSDESKKKMSESHRRNILLGIENPTGFEKGHKTWNKGIPISDNVRKAIIESNKRRKGEKRKQYVRKDKL